MATKYITEEINKAKVCIYPMTGVKAAYIEVRIHTGAAYENKDEQGVMHLIEHMLFQGTSKFPNKPELDYFQEEHGLSSNAWTSITDLGVWIKFPKNETVAAMELLDELLFHSQIPEKELQRETEVIIQEYRDFWSLPERRYGFEIRKKIFGPDSVLSRTALGEPDTIKRVSRDRLLKLKSEFFQPQNMIIAVAGNVNPTQILDKLHSVFDTEKNSSKKITLTKNDYLVNSSKIKFINHIEDVQNATVNLVWNIDGQDRLDLKQRLTLRIASYLLGSSRGKLYNRLRQELGLVYKTGVDRFIYDYNGVFELWAYTRPDQIKNVVEEMTKVKNEFLDNEISYKDFNRATRYLNISTLTSYDSVGNICEHIASDLFNEGKPISPEEYNKIAKGITEKDVRTLLAKYISKVEPYLFVMSKEKITI